MYTTNIYIYIHIYIYIYILSLYVYIIIYIYTYIDYITLHHVPSTLRPHENPQLHPAELGVRTESASNADSSAIFAACAWRQFGGTPTMWPMDVDV